MQEGGVALLPELLVLLTLHASHPLHHLFTQLHGRRQRFRISAQNVAEVDVEKLPWKRGQGQNTLLKQYSKPEGCWLNGAWKNMFASPVFVSSRLSRCLSPTPRMYVMTQYPAERKKKHRLDLWDWVTCSAGRAKICYTSRLTTALDVGVHHLWADAVGSFFARSMFPEEALLR